RLVLNKATRRIFRNGPRNLEPRSNDEDDSWASALFKVSRQSVCPHMYEFTTKHGGSSVESGFEPGTFWPRSRDVTTRPPRPF
ncbi:hypothetical protein AVEN_49694-1, partial [Araneus ventricosus]